MDASVGFRLHPDRLRHGNQPLLPWWLAQVRAREKRDKVRLLDVVDVHYYPQGTNIGVGTRGGIDPATSARRLRAPRSLWDPTYVDESWIGEPIRLVPRLREWVNENAPGLRIQIGEWNMGAEQHITGGLAVAETLGRFAQEDVFAAFYWDYPPADSPAAWAFRAFRNFDGKGGRFLDEWVPSSSGDPLLSAFVSRDRAAPGHLVIVLLDLDPSAGRETTLDLARCGQVTSERGFVYEAGAAGFLPQERGARAQPPYSMRVLDLQLSKP